MAIWAIGDLHLAIGVPEKSMEAFGEPWIGYLDKIASNWSKAISDEDLVLIPGDISWAMHPQEAKVDLEWIDKLPGTKLLLRGNHDYWWTSLRQIQAILPPSLHLIQNNAFFWKDVAIGGARLWDSSEYGFGSYIAYKENRQLSALSKKEDSADSEKIFMRELGRLELSLKAVQAKPSSLRIAMTHYPPISAHLDPSRTSALLEKYQIQTCIFGHLHSLKTPSVPLFGIKNGIQYSLTSADFLNFCPLRIV